MCKSLGITLLSHGFKMKPSGFFILDISGLTPKFIGGFHSTEIDFSTVAVEGDRLVVMDTRQPQLILFDVSAPANPQLISTYALAPQLVAQLQFARLTLLDGIIYLNHRAKQLTRFAIEEDSGQISEISPYFTDGYVQDFQVRPPLVYMVVHGMGLEIAQMEEDFMWTRLTPYRPAIKPDDMVLNGEWAYVADNGRGLHIPNLAHPAPEVRGTVSGPTPPNLQLADDGYLRHNH